MHTLILLAHPEENSLSAQLARVAQDSLERRGSTVELVDLYREAFDPLEAKHHYAQRLNQEFFSALSEQNHAAQGKTLPHDIVRAIDQLDRADLVVFQFPLWWWSMPAILKGWFDRVLVRGEVYTSRMRYPDKGRFRGKRAFLSVTTGAPAAAFGPDGRAGDLDLILWPIHFSLSYVGFEVLPPHRCHGVVSNSSELDRELGELPRRLEEFGAHIDALDSLEPIRFNSSSDWDDQGRLKAGANSFSPFIRHCD
jgi:NAD(P)H dehydrogenase (quinone)